MRKCIGCQNMKGKRELIRIVATPDGPIRLDPTGKLAGRGAYLCPSADCFERAHKRKALERALKRPVSAEVWELVKQQLEGTVHG
ncbi:MAG: YlxR family protein [Kyrpidia sp.]|nr:YlxR family protein [Kyrpidia sp.]